MANVYKEYRCENCGDIELYHGHKTVKRKCPTCKAKIELLISSPAIAKDGAPKTVGSLIEKNNKRNPAEREKVMGVGTEKKLEYQSKMRRLANADQTAINKYVETGNI